MPPFRGLREAVGVVSNLIFSRWFHCHREERSDVAISTERLPRRFAPRNDTRERTRRGWPTDFPPVCTMDGACMRDVEDAVPYAKDAVLSEQ